MIELVAQRREFRTTCVQIRAEQIPAKTKQTKAALKNNSIKSQTTATDHDKQ